MIRTPGADRVQDPEERPEEADAALADAPAGLDAEGLVRHGLAALRRR